MARIGRNLGEVDTSTGECAKSKCKTGSRTLHRHHRKHQAMWLGVWAGRRRGEDKFEFFAANYQAFDPKDWTRLCENHHAEIHLIYDEIIRKDRLKTGRPLSQYSWAQAEKLMAKLEAVCVEWLKKETPGVESGNLDELRARRHLTLLKQVTRRRTGDNRPNDDL